MKRTFIALALLFASTALAAVSLRSLPESDGVQAAVTDIAIEWSDGNISTGTSAVSAAKINGTVPSTVAAWKTLAVDLFAAELKTRTGDVVPANAKLRISSAPFGAKQIQAAVAAVAEGNAYDRSNPTTMKTLVEQAEKMVASLGHKNDVHFLAVKSRMVDTDSGEKRNVRIHAFINVKTSKMVQIFTIEGTM